jgi:hypothetical protein
MKYAQIKAIEQANKRKLLKAFPKLTDNSGIYVLTRSENGFKYAYIGQAKHILTRLAGHLKASSGIFDKHTQHIDTSIRKHGLYSEENPTGWYVEFHEYDEEQLDDREKLFIRTYANAGFQLRNKTAGGQNEGKDGLDVDKREPRGYRDGIKQGYKKAQKEVAKLFEKNLIYAINGKENKNKAKAYEKFRAFVGDDYGR